MGFEAVLFVRPPLQHAWIERPGSYRSVSLSRCFSRTTYRARRCELGMPRWVGRAIGLDVHREFCVVAICQDGVTRSAGRRI